MYSIPTAGVGTARATGASSMTTVSRLRTTSMLNGTLVGSSFKLPLATDLPVLLLSGDADPITPPRYAELAMVDLENAAHLIGKNQGHGQISVGCTRRLVADFIDSADPSGLDAECLERSFVMPFFLGFSGPNP